MRLNFYEPTEGSPSSPSSIARAYIAIVSFYVIIGITFYMMSGCFKGNTTWKFIDAFYFIVVSLCTFGYGDIVPDSKVAKMFTCGLILVGFGFIVFLLNKLVTNICDTNESFLLGMVFEKNKYKNLFSTLVDEEKEKMRIGTKLCVASTVVIVCIVTGTFIAYFVERLNWADSFYLLVVSVTTVGYGDYSFKTLAGRCFAIVWLLISTHAVGRAFLYLAGYIVHRRSREVAKRILDRFCNCRS